MLIILIYTYISNSSFNSFNSELTTIEMLNEYEELWKFLNENFKHYLDNLPVNSDELKNKYRNKIKQSSNFEDYYLNLNNMIDEMRFIGHIEIMDANTFFELKEKVEYFKNITRNTKFADEIKLAEIDLKLYSKYFNDLDSIKRYESIKSVNSDNLSNYKIQNETYIDLEFSRFKNKDLLYVYYPDFYYENREKYRNSLIEELNLYPYKYVIVDIVDNHGGSSILWQDLVSILSSKEIECTKYNLFDGRESKKFLKSYAKITNLDKNLIINKNDKLIFEEKLSIKPDNSVINKPENIYLIQGFNASASEEFCEFVKNSNWADSFGISVGGSGQGTPYYYKLKNSGLIIYLTISYPCNSDGSLKSLEINPKYPLDVENINIFELIDSIIKNE